MKSKRLSLDVISKLPNTLIDMILCLLSIEEAAKTSILSREWRYKWTQIPKLAFVSRKTPSERGLTLDTARAREKRMGKLFSIMHQILLLRHAPIHEFFFSIETVESCLQLDQILIHLSRNHTVKKLSLEFDGITMYKLPFSIFSLHHLTDLYLTSISFNFQPTFTGFGNVRTLYLKDANISSKALLHLLSKCRSLTCLSLLIRQCNIDILALFRCLPLIECLTTSCSLLEALLPGRVPEELPTLLIHLKYFCFEDFYFAPSTFSSFVSMMIKSSPNLEKVKLEMLGNEEPCSIKLLEDSDFWFEQLNELEITGFCNFKPKMEFVKFVLARSPKLKKVRITSLLNTAQEDIIMLKDLLRAPRASPVQVIVQRD